MSATTSPATTPPSRIRVVLIEDQTLVAEGIVAVLRQIAGLEVLRVFPSASAALAQAPILHGADLALVDFHLGAREEEKRLRELRAELPELRWIWLSGAVSTASLLQIEELRFHGFVHKDDPATHLRDAVLTVSKGGVYRSPTAQNLLAGLSNAPNSPQKLLSSREQEILTLVGQGLTNEEIAAILSLSVTTVQTHRRNIMGKLDLHTSLALQAYAQQQGFAPPPPA